MRPFGEPAEDIRIELGERRPDREQVEDLQADVRVTNELLRQARAEEEAHFQGNDQWDDKKDRPKKVAATSPFWKGDDWTAEEKQALRLAQAAIGLGSVYGAGVVLSGVFRAIGASEGQRAAVARSDAEELATGNVTTVNQALENSAIENYRGQIVEITNAGIAAIGAVVLGAYQYWTVCANHKENVEKLNRPDVTKKREGLEARLARLRERLAGELARLDEAMRDAQLNAQLEEAHGGGHSTESM